jgi:hypothetical protein
VSLNVIVVVLVPDSAGEIVPIQTAVVMPLIEQQTDPELGSERLISRNGELYKGQGVPQNTDVVVVYCAVEGPSVTRRGCTLQ